MMPSPVTTANVESLRATTVVQQTVGLCISIRMNQRLAINFVDDDIAHYDIILGMAWLKKKTPDIHWDTGV